MHKMFKNVLTVIIGLATSIAANAAIIATYDFNSGPSAAPGPVNGTTFGSFSAGSGLTAHPVSGEYGMEKWSSGTSFAAAQTANTYVQFVITPNTSAGSFVLNSIQWDANTGSDSPTSLMVRIAYGTTTIDSQTLTLARGTTSGNDGMSFTPPSTISTISPITISFFAWNAKDQGNNAYISFDNVGIDGIAPVPEPASVALGIFGGLFGVSLIVRSRPVRRRLQRWRTAASHSFRLV